MVVVHGGEDASGQDLADAWEYGALGWVPGAPTPPTMLPRRNHAMAYLSGRMVVFGGSAAGAPDELSETWEYDGTTWTLMPAAPPALRGRTDPAMASMSGSVVLFGGGNGTLGFDDTWHYDGTWTESGKIPAGLLCRSATAAAYDSVRRRLVLFGGQTYGAPYTLDDTWEYDGTTWIAGPAAPVAMGSRGYHAMSFDVARVRVMLFGGGNNSDTWEYDGTAWTLGAVAPGSLSPRQLAVMAYDSVRRRTVMFGGTLFQGGILDDT